MLAGGERGPRATGIGATLRVLVVNAGSSSLKLTLLDARDALVEARELDAPHARVDPEQLDDALGSALGEADAIGHRIVHGGSIFREAVRIDTDVERELRALVDLAPLHQPKSLAALDAITERLPRLPAVACFDTAFHATLPAPAFTYALPGEWRERWGLRRYGFHGLSHAWVARRTPELLGREHAGLRIVSCHLGAGASLCAISGGHSLDTTMGFTPLEGLVMATRAGDLDPGMLLWLLEREELGVRELSEALEHSSGLTGMAGTPDMREVLLWAAAGDERAVLARDVYLHRLRAGIAAMAASMSGLDALVFTGGVGEHAPEVRARAAAGLAFLGVGLDEQLNEHAAGDTLIAAEQATVETLVLAAREDLEIARQVRTLLGGA